MLTWEQSNLRPRASSSFSEGDGLLESTTHANQQSRIYMTHNSAYHTSTYFVPHFEIRSPSSAHLGLLVFGRPLQARPTGALINPLRNPGAHPILHTGSFRLADVNLPCPLCGADTSKIQKPSAKGYTRRVSELDGYDKWRASETY